MFALKMCSAVALSVLCALSTGLQTLVADLPSPLRAHLDDERFQTVTSIRGLPLGVRDQLQTMFGGSLDISDAASGNAPSLAATPSARRLIAAGCSRDHHCLLYYELGGSSRSWRVMLFHWTPEATRFEWGGVAPRNLTTIEAVRAAALSGAIKGTTGPW